MWHLFVWNPTSVRNRIYGPDAPIIWEMGGAFLAVAVQPHLRSVLSLCVGLVESFWRRLFEPHQHRRPPVVGPQWSRREPFIKGGASVVLADVEPLPKPFGNHLPEE